jgi:heavy metal sensor kinase
VTLPIRARLSIWYAALLAVILAALGAFLLLRMRADLVTGVDGSLDARAAQISLGYQGSGEGEFQDVTDASLVRLPQGEHAAQIISATGSVLESSGDVVADAPMLDLGAVTRILAGAHVRATVSLGTDREPFRLLAIPSPNRQDAQVLVVATSLEGVNGAIRRLLVLLLTAGPAALGAAVLVGWWLARKALLPVARMSEEASGIGIDRLDERIAIPAVDDELASLARTLNAMLDRLDRGVEEKRRFVADASHELRTPLSVMRAEIEVSLRSDQLGEEARAVLNSAEEEVERMSRMVENLLTLARLDEGQLLVPQGPLDLGELAADVTAELRPLAEENGIALSCDGARAETTGDHDRLRQVVANLVDNAIKYTGRGGEVRVQSWSRGTEAGVTVSDTGPGIAPEFRQRVFDRFYRQDPARNRTAGGAGLGLAICREVVEAHGGRIWVESEVGRGSAFSLALPLSSTGRPVTSAAV